MTNMLINKQIDEKDTVQYKIWHTTFLCQMRDIDTKSIDYLKIFGTLDSGDPRLNMEASNEMVLRRLTIIEMIKYFHDGINVFVKNPEDCKKIYILIQEHLQNWSRELQYTLRPDSVPTEELLIMEQFADVVYEHAKWYLDSALVDSPFARSMKADSRSVLGILKKPDVENDPNDIIALPKRESMSDIFSAGGAKMIKRFEK